MKTKQVIIIRWIARITGAFLIALVVFMFVADDGPPNPFELTDIELQLFASMTLMFVGLVIAYKNELIGGLIAMGGYIFFDIVEKSINNGPIFPLFFVVGALYLFCWWQDKKERNKIL